MVTPPTCGKCGLVHWRFKSCAVADEEHRSRPHPAPPHWKHEVEGQRPWGDQLYSLKRQGSNTFWRNHDDEPPEAA